MALVLPFSFGPQSSYIARMTIVFRMNKKNIPVAFVWHWHKSHTFHCLMWRLFMMNLGVIAITITIIDVVFCWLKMWINILNIFFSFWFRARPRWTCSETKVMLNVVIHMNVCMCIPIWFLLYNPFAVVVVVVALWYAVCNGCKLKGINMNLVHQADRASFRRT